MVPVGTGAGITIAMAEAGAARKDIAAGGINAASARVVLNPRQAIARPLKKKRLAVKLAR